MDATDRDLIIRTVLAEGGSKASPDEQAAIAHVIKNRMGDPQYGSGVRDVLFQKNAFEPWGAGMRTNNPMRFDAKSDDYANTAKVVDDVLAGKSDDPTHGADRFQQPEIVNQRYRMGRVSASALAPKDAQRIGSQVFWSTRKNDQSLLDEFYKGKQPQPAQTATATPEVPITASAPDHNALLDEFYPSKPQTAGLEPGAVAAADKAKQAAAAPAEIPQAAIPDAIPMGRESIPVSPEVGKAFSWIGQHPIQGAALGASLPLAAGAGELAPAIPAAAGMAGHLFTKVAPYAIPAEIYRGGQDVINLVNLIRSHF